LVRLEIVLILTLESCTVWAEHTIGSEIVLHAPGDMGDVESHFGRLETMLVSVQDRCSVCVERTIALEIVLDTHDGIAR
jgi:hypothetical protein